MPSGEDMTLQTILVSRSDAATIVQMNRPDRRNAISLQMMSEIVAALDEAERDPAVRSVIITGGTECFSAGADLNEALQVRSVPAAMDFLGNLHRLNNRIETLDKPVIAAIEGFCMTGGLELALACDLRVAGEGASFAITSARIGTVPGAGGTQRLPRIVGKANALELLYAAEPIACDDAFRIGLINRRTERGGALKEALAMARVHAERAPLSLALIKRAVHRGLQTDIASGLELETFLVSSIYTTQDKEEGISAFLEKRKPQFRGI
jgi:enoyl-CoA hydratase/carnithine racemase